MSKFDENVGFSPRKLRIACIGSGFSGLTFIHKATTDPKYKDIVDIVAYEKNSTVGGTWHENSYPGVQCDIPSHAYHLSFAPNPFWSQVFAPGNELAEYLENSAQKFDLKKYIQFESKVVETIWDEDLGRWKLKIDHNSTIKEDEVDFLVLAAGYLNTPNWPDLPGLDIFQGKILHSAAWDRSYDYKGKRVAVLGNGASGLQVFAAMQPDVASITSYIRNPTWFSQPLSFEKLGEDTAYSKEEIKEFSEDPAKFKTYLKKIEREANDVFNFFLKDGPGNKMVLDSCKKLLDDNLNEELVSKIVPEFPPGCRRLTPGINYLKALGKPNAALNQNKIVSLTHTGIETADGLTAEYDLIVCATGFDRSFIPQWKMIGRDNVDLKEKWSKEDPKAFKSLWVENMPNAGWLFCAPRAPTATGSIPRAMSFISDNILSWIRKISLEGIKSMVVKPEIVEEYNAYQDLLLEKTVFSANCKSGYKNEKGTVTGQFGGSMSLFVLCGSNTGKADDANGGIVLLEDLHAECFDIKFRSQNRFAFLGNGMTGYDATDPAWYMDE